MATEITLRRALTIALAVVFLVSGLVMQAEAQGKGKNGTTLAASKSVEVCVVDDNTWRYKGLISIWNAGVLDTLGCPDSERC